MYFSSSLSLSLSLSFLGHGMSPHHSDQKSQRSQSSGIALCRCSLNVFVFVIVSIFVFVFVFVSFFGQVMSPHHSDQMSQKSQVFWVTLWQPMACHMFQNQKCDSLSHSVTHWQWQCHLLSCQTLVLTAKKVNHHRHEKKIFVLLNSKKILKSSRKNHLWNDLTRFAICAHFNICNHDCRIQIHKDFPQLSRFFRRIYDDWTEMGSNSMDRGKNWKKAPWSPLLHQLYFP